MTVAAPTKATATVKGGFWPENSITSLVSIQGSGSWRRRAQQLLMGKGARVLREIMFTDDGAAAGDAALAAHARVQTNSELGGKRTIETETLLDRVTVAGDVTETKLDIHASLTAKTTMASPINKDRNPLGTR